MAIRYYHFVLCWCPSSSNKKQSKIYYNMKVDRVPIESNEKLSPTFIVKLNAIKDTYNLIGH